MLGITLSTVFHLQHVLVAVKLHLIFERFCGVFFKYFELVSAKYIAAFFGIIRFI